MNPIPSREHTVLQVNQATIPETIDRVLADVIEYLPTLVGAIVILLVGYVVGRILGGIVTRVLRRIGIGRYARGTAVEEAADEEDNIARAIGRLVAYYVYFVAILAAANVLGIALLSELLSDLGAFLPVILGAVAILVIGFVTGRIVGDVVGDVVGGFDVGRYLAGTPLEGLGDTEGEFGRIVGTLVSYYVYLLTLVAAADVLEIAALSTLLNDFAGYLPALVGGLVVFVVGVWLAEVAEDLVAGADEGRSARLAGLAVKIFIYYVTITIAVSTIGFETAILTNFFTTFVAAFLGALAIALAIGIGIAVGLGGQEYVAENVDGWVEQARGTVSEEEGGESPTE